MSNQQHTTAKRSRIEEIEAELMAYRLGWMQYDREHVRRLQAERAAIANAEQAEAQLAVAKSVVRGVLAK